MGITSTIKDSKIKTFSLTYQSELIWHLVKRDFIIQYKRSFLGVLWSLLIPLAQFLVLTFIFQTVIPLNIEAYPVFLFSALLPWSWFSNCLGSAGGIFLNNRNLLLRPNFEPSLLLIVNTLSNLILFLVSLPILLIIMSFFGKSISINFIYLPLLILIEGIIIFGLGLIIATINVLYSDVQHIVNVGLMILFFVTPVFYGIYDIKEGYRYLYSLNPLAPLIQNYRLIIYNSSPPDWSSILFTGIISLIACIIGLAIYNRKIHDVIDTMH